MVQLLNSGETTLAKSLVTKAGTPSEGGDLWWTGYLLGIVQRAANRIDRDREAQAQFAVAVIGALLNALPVTIMVPAALLLEIVDEARGDALKGENLGDLLLHGMKASLTGEGHRAVRDLLGNGFADALDSRVQTR